MVGGGEGVGGEVLVFCAANGHATANATQRRNTSLPASTIGLIVKRHNGFLLTGLSIFSALTHVISKHGRNTPVHSATLPSPTAGASRLHTHLPKVSAVNSELAELSALGDHTMRGLSHGTTFTVLVVFVVAWP